MTDVAKEAPKAAKKAGMASWTLRIRPAKSNRTFKIGHSRVMLAYLFGFFLVWSFILLVITSHLAEAKTFFVVVPTALLLMLISVGIRAMRVAVFDDPETDKLVVRNYFATLRIPRGSVRSVGDASVGEPSRLASPAQLVTRDGGKHPLDVFTRPLLSANSKKAHADGLERLKKWARTGR